MPGDIFLITLNDTQKVLSQVLNGAFIGFRSKLQSDPTFQSLRKSELAFQVVPHTSVYKDPRFNKIGNLEIDPSLYQPPKTYVRDIVDKNRFRILDGHNFIDSTFDQCIGLEQSMVYDIEHIFARLNDYSGGVTNPWRAEMSPLKRNDQ